MINIIMCTYNGEKYIRQQLQSIVDSTVTDWKILISDDQSTDSTIRIAHEFQKQYPDKIQIKVNDTKKGAIINFLSSIYQVGTTMEKDDFIMLCDQDDIWNSDKIEKTERCMNKLIKTYGNEMPLLVCTDVTVVDDELKIIHESFRRMNKYQIRHLDFSHLMMENKVQGCTTMINKSLALMLDKLPTKTTMHDGWLALIASAFGHIEYIDEQTMKYRQHPDNVQGSIAYEDDVKNKFSNLGGQRQIVMNTTAQIGEFLEIYGEKIPDNLRNTARAFSTLNQQNFITRRYNIIKYHMWKSGFLRNIGLMILI